MLTPEIMINTEDMDDIADAIIKVYENRDKLTSI